MDGDLTIVAINMAKRLHILICSLDAVHEAEEMLLCFLTSAVEDAETLW